MPHKKLIEVYLKYLTPSTVCVGRRCYIDKNLTDKILETKNLKLFSVFNILKHAKRLGHAFYSSPLIQRPTKSKRSRSIIGCNWAVYKQNILDVNGYDEDYQQAGEGEDFDIDWRFRMLNSNIIFLNVKHQAITYHLYHPMNYSSADTDKSRAMKLEKNENRVLYLQKWNKEIGLIFNRQYFNPVIIRIVDEVKPHLFVFEANPTLLFVVFPDLIVVPLYPYAQMAFIFSQLIILRVVA